MPKKRIRAMPNESPAKKVVQFELRVSEDSTPSRKRLSSHCASKRPTRTHSGKWQSPRRCNSDREESDAGKGNGSLCNLAQSPRKNLFDNTHQKIKWNPRDPALMQAVKQALHVATSPAAVVCREEEQNSILEFCKSCIQQKRAGSLYVCRCPGTGKTLSIGKVQEYLMEWSKELLPLFISITHTVEENVVFVLTLLIFSAFVKILVFYPRLQFLSFLFYCAVY